MRLTTFTDYSLRVLVHLATAPGGRATIAQIAASYGISENTLVKVAHVLGKSGVLHNVRGHGGGIELARSPAAINVGAVVRMTEGADRPAECFDPERSACVIAPVCTLAGVLHRATQAFYAVLDSHSLADLVREPEPIAAILHRHPTLTRHAP